MPQPYTHSSPVSEDILTETFMPVPAARWKRLVNYIFDTIVYWMALFVLQLFIASMTDEYLTPDAYLFWTNEWTRLALSFAVYFVVMWLSEWLMNGRSIGKLVTNTQAIKTNQERFTWMDALHRSLVRLIPVDGLSILWGEIWHDQWTGTMVVDNAN